MSMMARFVAITPDQLAEIKDSPEMVEGLFTQNAGLQAELQVTGDLFQRVPDIFLVFE